MSIIAGSAFQYLRDQLFNGIHDPENDALFFAMYTTKASINPETADLQSSLTDELVGSGYPAGGFALTQTVIYTPGGNARPVMDFNDIVIPVATWGITNDAAQGAVIYNTTAGPQSNKIMWILNFGSPVAVNNGQVTIKFPDPSTPTLAIVRSSG
jgi:hypothetical protein